MASALPGSIAVEHRGVTRRLRARSVRALRALAASAFGLARLPELMFETHRGERAAVDTDLALAMAASATPAAGRIVIVASGATSPPPPEHLPAPRPVSVAQCATTVLAAVVDTAARADVAAALLALSAAIPRGDEPGVGPSSSSPPPSPPPPARSPPLSPRSPSPVARGGAPGSPMQLSPPASRPASPRPASGALAAAAAGAPAAAAGPTPESCFCVHIGVSCGGCAGSPITGTRYRCVQCHDLNLCEACRRSGAHCGDRHCFVVFDHPWEASDEYAGMVDGFRAPPAPLALGDRGPRVVHLHFVLYTLGYLFLLAPGFRPDRFTAATRDALAQFQSEFEVRAPQDAPRGAYSARTRACVLKRFDDLDAPPPVCRAEATSASSPPRLRSVLAA